MLALKQNDTIEVFARAIGTLHWLCPVCNFIHDATQINWRRPAVKCKGRFWPLAECNSTFRLGLLFAVADASQRLPPFNAVLAKPLKKFTTNRTVSSGNLGPVSPAIAHIKGRLDFCCPLCYTYNARRVDWMGVMKCGDKDNNKAGCGTSWRVAVIFHPYSAAIHRLILPIDWSVTSEMI
jgi:hypothetical protein